MVVGHQEDDENYVIGTRDIEGSYAMIYFPTGQERTLSLSSLKGTEFTVWWFDPRTGNSFSNDVMEKTEELLVKPPTSGKGNDWILVLDSNMTNSQAPGQAKP
jgi:hypothetical protein